MTSASSWCSGGGTEAGLAVFPLREGIYDAV